MKASELPRDINEYTYAGRINMASGDYPIWPATIAMSLYQSRVHSMPMYPYTRFEALDGYKTPYVADLHYIYVEDVDKLLFRDGRTLYLVDPF